MQSEHNTQLGCCLFIMLSSFFRIAVIFLSRTVAKVFLFLALSVSTPAVNAMRSINEREAIFIIVDHNCFRRRERSLIRRFGYQPELRFVFYELANYGI